MPDRPLISIVDDDESVRVAISGLVRSLGYAAETFASAEDFIGSRHRDRTSCLIADVNLPGMSGPALHRHLIASTKAIPTILITAYPDDEVRVRALSDGANGYLTKPFHEADLIGCVHMVLGEDR